MNLIKHSEFFNPIIDLQDAQLHIIGCGAIGSFVAEALTRLGCPELHIYDFDTVEEANITNQLYTHSDIGKRKIDALSLKLKEINPNITICPHQKWEAEANTARDYVFMCVDNIQTRKDIVNTNKYNSAIKAIFDFRMNLKDAQHYAAKWTSDIDKEKLIKSMDFTDKEAKENTPISPCGTTLSISPTVHAIVAAGIANFINIAKDNKYATTIVVNPFSGQQLYL